MLNSKIVGLIPWLLVAGSILVVVGCMFKLQYWPGASILLVLGLTLEAVAIPLLILYLWKNRSSGSK